MKTAGTWLAVAVLGVLALAEAAGRTPGGDAPDETRRAARRRWALARMDEMANEARRCAERFQDAGRAAACREGFARRYREYNELYLDATRE
jgi:hypothetical protein